MNGVQANTMIRTPNELANQHVAVQAKQTRRLKVLKSLTMAQLVIGLVVVCLEVFTMLFFQYQTDLMPRIGNAILIMIASLLIVCRGKNSTSNCQIVAHLVLAIIIVLDEAGLIIKNLTRATTVGFEIGYGYGYDDEMFWDHYHLTIVVGTMMVLDCVLFMLFIWSSVIASRVSYCCRQQPPHAQMVVLQQGNPTMDGHQQPMYIMHHPASPNGGMVWQPIQGGMMVQPNMVTTNIPAQAPVQQPIVQPGQSKQTEAMQQSTTGQQQSTSAAATASNQQLPADTDDLPTYEQSTAVPMETTDPTARLLLEQE